MAECNVRLLATLFGALACTLHLHSDILH